MLSLLCISPFYTLSLCKVSKWNIRNTINHLDTYLQVICIYTTITEYLKNVYLGIYDAYTVFRRYTYKYFILHQI